MHATVRVRCPPGHWLPSNCTCTGHWQHCLQYALRCTSVGTAFIHILDNSWQLIWPRIWSAFLGPKVLSTWFTLASTKVLLKEWNWCVVCTFKRMWFVHWESRCPFHWPTAPDCPCYPFPLLSQFTKSPSYKSGVTLSPYATVGSHRKCKSIQGAAVLRFTTFASIDTVRQSSLFSCLQNHKE